MAWRQREAQAQEMEHHAMHQDEEVFLLFSGSHDWFNTFNHPCEAAKLASTARWSYVMATVAGTSFSVVLRLARRCATAFSEAKHQMGAAGTGKSLICGFLHELS